MWAWRGRTRFVRALDAAAVERAIADAERRTSGEIVVSIAPFFLGRVRRAAERTFQRLNVGHTRAKNGVLVFVVPARRAFVILGDEGIHQAVGQGFWDALVAEVSSRFRGGDPTGGLVAAVTEVGARLATAFPHDATTDANELPDGLDGLRSSSR